MENKIIDKLKSEVKDLNLKAFEQDTKLETINKKLSILKEKDKYGNLVLKVDEMAIKLLEKEKDYDEVGTINKDSNCEKCGFGLIVHTRAEHTEQNRIKCWKFATKRDVIEHNDKYWYSHRMCLNSNHKRYILEEFEQLKKDGFTVKEDTVKINKTYFCLLD